MKIDLIPTCRSVDSQEKVDNMLDAVTPSESSVSGDDQENYTMRPAFAMTQPSLKIPNQKKLTVKNATTRQEPKQNNIAFIGKRTFKSTR